MDKLENWETNPVCIELAVATIYDTYRVRCKDSYVQEVLKQYGNLKDDGNSLLELLGKRIEVPQMFESIANPHLRHVKNGIYVKIKDIKSISVTKTYIDKSVERKP